MSDCKSSFLAFAPGSAELSPAAKAQLTEMAKGVGARQQDWKTWAWLGALAGLAGGWWLLRRRSAPAE